MPQRPTRVVDVLVLEMLWEKLQFGRAGAMIRYDRLDDT